MYFVNYDRFLCKLTFPTMNWKHSCKLTNACNMKKNNSNWWLLSHKVTVVSKNRRKCLPVNVHVNAQWNYLWSSVDVACLKGNLLEVWQSFKEHILLIYCIFSIESIWHREKKLFYYCKPWSLIKQICQYLNSPKPLHVTKVSFEKWKVDQQIIKGLQNNGFFSPRPFLFKWKSNQGTDGGWLSFCKCKSFWGMKSFLSINVITSFKLVK